MRLHSAKVPQIAAEMLENLLQSSDIETENPAEVKADIESVLNQYIRDEQEISDRARELVAARGLPPTELARAKKLAADERKMKIGEDAIDYLLDQLVEMLMHSGNVEEVFAEDYVLRRKMRDPLRKQLSEGADLQQEVRDQLKHVKEGTALWEVEYKRMMEDIKRRKGL